MTYKMNGMVLTQKEVDRKKKVLGMINQLNGTNYNIDSLGISAMEGKLNCAKPSNKVYGGSRK